MFGSIGSNRATVERHDEDSHCRSDDRIADRSGLCPDGRYGWGRNGCGRNGWGEGWPQRGAAKATSDPNAAKKNMAEEKAYNDALKRIPNKPFDPWGGVRDVPKK